MKPENLFNQISKQSHLRDLTSWKPEILNPSEAKDLKRLNEIFTNFNPIVTDDILEQVKELVKCMYPKERLSGEGQTQKALAHFGETDQDMYGVWVYYSWSNRLVHLLAEKEYTLVRTNRNHYKISPQEQAELATRKVGLIGLSVGQSVAVTLAMERGFGELRLADFDVLELTNLNRIRTGIHNLGMSKVISVAREIMEIDPFLKLRCFTDGITEENLDSFFTEGGNLDLLIDECDGLEIKVLSRHKAREMKIPVVMEASDRGMVDVERFDLEPDRPLLHGLMKDLNPEKLKTLETNEDKMPYMLDIVGIETISTRAKASMLEIGETITTWPQLASAVTLGGGITADVVRRIFLNQFTDSGRFYMDVEQIIGDKKPVNETAQAVKQIELPTSQIDLGTLQLSSAIPAQVLEEIVHAACMAPSGGNLQPWKWVKNGEKLQLKQLTELKSDFLDHNNIASYIALGASLENAVLKSNELGFSVEVSDFPNTAQPELIAELTLQDNPHIDSMESELGEQVLLRSTNRNIEKGPDLTQDHVTHLKELAVQNGSELLILTDDRKEKLAKLIAFAERFRILHETGHKNFVDEMRWTQEDVERTKDGIDIATCDLTEGELAGFKLATNRDVIEKLIEWEGGAAFENLSKKSTESAAALGIITRPAESAQDFINSGRDLERVWIGANAKGIGVQPQSPLSLIFQRLKDSDDLDENQFNELNEAKKLFDELISPLTNRVPVFIFRLFYANRPVVKSLRRPLNKHFESIK